MSRLCLPGSDNKPLVFRIVGCFVKPFSVGVGVEKEGGGPRTPATRKESDVETSVTSLCLSDPTGTPILGCQVKRSCPEGRRKGPVVYGQGKRNLVGAGSRPSPVKSPLVLFQVPIGVETRKTHDRSRFIIFT